MRVLTDMHGADKQQDVKAKLSDGWFASVRLLNATRFLMDVVNLKQKLTMFSDHWNPRVIGRCNGNEVRIAKVKGEFTWHSHPDSDEMFLVLAGQLEIQFRDKNAILNEGDMLIVPRGVQHRPVAREEAHILMLDVEGESNTGDQPSSLTRDQLEKL